MNKGGIPKHFLEEGKHNTFRIVAEETTFYVKGHFLSEISSFFYAASFGEFSEAREKLTPHESEVYGFSQAHLLHPLVTTRTLLEAAFVHGFQRSIGKLIAQWINLGEGFLSSKLMS
ncbi:hypothetical protein KIN20_037158 [Parelaphostrongylus tenuis]|uniref:Uncharacterized protein n=1 Tax=Parelaphostrongylus tenuis TaxID=148309 RepID=A0AAD5WM86_PARTN|nr:hypothetical protein KIN20_037158 [Parelaphostrongylus tenuis]